MVIKAIIALCGLFLVALITVINLFVVLKKSQNNIAEEKERLKQEVIACLDMIPLVTYVKGIQDEEVLKLREDWYTSRDDVVKHWLVWQEISGKHIGKWLTETENGNNEDMRRFRKKVESIAEVVHAYNSAVLSHERRLSKAYFRVVKSLGFGLDKSKYEILGV